MERDIFEELRKELENKNLTPEEKTKLIKQAGDEYNKQADEQFYRAVGKSVLGATIEAAAMSAPIGTVGIGTKFVWKAGLVALERKFGKKLVQDTLTGAIDGAIASAAFGAGRGLLENKNILTSSIQDAVFGLGIGGLTGASMANLQRILHEVNFQAYKNPEVLKQVGKKNAAKEIKKYYRDYIQGTVDSHPGIGEYHYTGDGIRETLTQKFDNALEVSTLRKNVKNADYKGIEGLAHERNPKSNIKKFHRFSAEDTDYIFSENKSGKINYHISRPTNTIKKPEGTNGPITEEPSGSGKFPPTKSISDYLEKNNPAEWLFVVTDSDLHFFCADTIIKPVK